MKGMQCVILIDWFGGISSGVHAVLQELASCQAYGATCLLLLSREWPAVSGFDRYCRNLVVEHDGFYLYF